MRAADEIIDIGPMAGIHGGEVVFQGKDSDLRNQKNSLTAQYLTQEKVIEIPKTKRKQYMETCASKYEYCKFGKYWYFKMADASS